MITITALLGVFAVFAAGEQGEAKQAQTYTACQVRSGPLKTSRYGAKLASEKFGSVGKLPAEFSWGAVGKTDQFEGMNFLTRTRNQHIPNYCGSCWAQAAVSVLSDRVNIQRPFGRVPSVYSVQAIMNCSGRGCNGGDASEMYHWMAESKFNLPTDNCLSYEACSPDSAESPCLNRDFSCKAINICRTCSTFTANGGSCASIHRYPNVTVSDFAAKYFPSVTDIKMELFTAGPVSSTINAEGILAYGGGVVDDDISDKGTNHAVSIVGWGVEPESRREYWIVRNSWGDYWGENGFFRILTGKNILGIESEMAVPVIGSVSNDNFPCAEDGSNCAGSEDGPDVDIASFYANYEGSMLVNGIPAHLSALHSKKIPAEFRDSLFE